MEALELTPEDRFCLKTGTADGTLAVFTSSDRLWRKTWLDLLEIALSYFYGILMLNLVFSYL
jgi:hypothetical protein